MKSKVKMSKIRIILLFINMHPCSYCKENEKKTKKKKVHIPYWSSSVSDSVYIYISSLVQWPKESPSYFSCIYTSSIVRVPEKPFGMDHDKR